MNEIVQKLHEEFEKCTTEELLSRLISRYQGGIALASSFGAEDQVLTDMMLRLDPKVTIFSLDTGRLPQETYALITETRRRYHKQIQIYFPQTEAVEAMEREFGPDLFYESIEYRKKCCQVRKIEPLRRALQNVEVWVTGLRREQAITRGAIEVIEWDGSNQLIKLNPLADWTLEQVWDYIRTNQVPYNKLHDHNYPSIGCAPCTRPVEPGQNLRSGRWWWEEPEHKECGLHKRSYECFSDELTNILSYECFSDE